MAAPRITAIEQVIVLALVCLAMTSSASAQTLDRIQAGETLRIGFIADHAPIASSESGGVPVGYAIDLCNEVAGEVDQRIPGAKVQYVETTIAQEFGAIADSRIDILCGATTATLDRRETAHFSEPIFITEASALPRSDSSRSLLELYMGEREISRLSWRMDPDQFGNCLGHRATDCSCCSSRARTRAAFQFADSR